MRIIIRPDCTVINGTPHRPTTLEVIMDDEGHDVQTVEDLVEFYKDHKEEFESWINR